MWIKVKEKDIKYWNSKLEGNNFLKYPEFSGRISLHPCLHVSFHHKPLLHRTWVVASFLSFSSRSCWTSAPIMDNENWGAGWQMFSRKGITWMLLCLRVMTNSVTILPFAWRWSSDMEGKGQENPRDMALKSWRTMPEDTFSLNILGKISLPNVSWEFLLQEAKAILRLFNLFCLLERRFQIFFLPTVV